MKIIKKIVCVLLTVCVLCSTNPTIALYNDAKFDDYENMRDKGGVIKYTVPNLFRDDEPTKNVKRFPLVVQNSVEYVPLEVFMGLSDIGVNNDLPDGDFYIYNSANEKYVSFDVSKDIATSHLNRPFTLVTKVFYSTRYVPVRSVCDLLGISYDVYDDKVNKVYAVRVTNGNAKIKMADLIKMYSPVKIENPEPLIEPELPNQGSIIFPEKDPDIIPENIQIPTQPETPEKEKTIRLMFYNAPNSSTSKIIKLLDTYKYKATFFCTEQQILDNPNVLREIYVSGHSVGMYIEKQAGEIESTINGINEALEFVSKRATRICATDGSFDHQTEKACLAAAGVDKYTSNLWASYGKSKDGFETIKQSISQIDTKQHTTTANIGFYCNEQTVELLKLLLPHISSKKMYKVTAIY